ncbi:MAG: pentapeptide repeat-containing protein [Hyphomicrobium sp.]|nr:pentapeptide repeat-containing protein [Hyphomicrobium sp.]
MALLEKNVSTAAGRCAVRCGLFVCLLAALAGGGAVAAADFTARQVTEAFHKATAQLPPDFSGRDLSFLDLAGIDFKGASLSGANLYGSDLTKANLKGSNLSGVMLDRASIVSADFSGAILAGASLLRPSINVALDRNPRDAPKFAGANLRGARITAMMDGADFRGADLTDANLGPYDLRADMSSMPGSILRGSDFSGAILRRADLMWAKLRFSKFVGADLRDVNFAGADLSKCDLSGADVTGANLMDADLDGAILSGVRGLDTVNGGDTIKNLATAVR